MNSATGPEDQASHRHIPALDGVRGLAVLLVIFHHMSASLKSEFAWYSPVITVAEVGWSGVDLFFVLSGFLITGILLDAKGKAGFFRNFYARRTLRIFPLYYLALTLVLLLRWVWPDAGFYPVASQGWLWVYATNVVISVNGFGQFGLVEHFWSLAVEEHFYLVWPWLVFTFSDRTLLRIAGGMWVAAFAVRCVMVLVDAPAPAPYVFTLARMDALSAGGFIALAARRYGSVESLRRTAWPVGVTAAAVFCGTVLWRGTFNGLDRGIVTIGSSALAATFASVIVLAVSQPQIRRGFEWRTLRVLGKYSYGLYVWHAIVFLLVMHSDPARRLRGGEGLLPALTSVAVALGLTVVVTGLSFHLVEKPFLTWKRHFSTRPPSPSPTATVGLVEHHPALSPSRTNS